MTRTTTGVGRIDELDGRGEERLRLVEEARTGVRTATGETTTTATAEEEEASTMTGGATTGTEGETTEIEGRRTVVLPRTEGTAPQRLRRPDGPGRPLLPPRQLRPDRQLLLLERHLCSLRLLLLPGA